MQESQRFYLKMATVLGVVAIVICALYFNRTSLPENQMSVSAEGSVFAVPNIAEITLGVSTQDRKTAQIATSDNVKLMNAVITALEDAGVEEKDIKTTGYNLYPNYDYSRETGRELTGWNLDQQVQVKIRDLDTVGDVLAKATEAGANQAGGVSFTIDDEDALQTQARNEAIVKAQVQAEEIAKAAGMKLGKVVNVYENQVSQPYPMYARAEADFGLGAAGGGIPSPEIQPGENEVVVNVTLVYEVK